MGKSVSTASNQPEYDASEARLLEVLKPGDSLDEAWTFLTVGGHRLRARLLDEAFERRLAEETEPPQRGDWLLVTLRNNPILGEDGVISSSFDIIRVEEWMRNLSI